MAKQIASKPWHEVLELRDDLKTGELSLSVFAADLYDVIMQRGYRKAYEDPAEFFALTYPTLSLRELVKDVCLRLAGNTDRAYRKLSVNYGGGKTHTLITLWHLVQNPDELPDLPAVHEFEAHAGPKLPQARAAALCFDKIDLELGIETMAPGGVKRMLRYPWSVLAFQLAGADGLRMLHPEGLDEERETPPAEPLMEALLRKPQEEGLATLVLLDEVLTYLRVLSAAASPLAAHLVSFFQYLTQAAVKVDRCAMVASLLASDDSTEDRFSQEFKEIYEVFGRQMESEVTPVDRADVAEVLRRRFFKPESIRNRDAFRPHVARAVGNIADLDEQTRKGRQSAEDRFLVSYPFHPDLTDLFYSRWTQLDGFQRTRGILRTFAIALRDAEEWDSSPLIGPNVFLSKPDAETLSEAARDLVSFAREDPDTSHRQAWQPILESELAKARDIQSDAIGLRHRELEQTVVSVFLSSQPVGQKALTRDLITLISATKPDQIDLEKSLLRWTEVSWFLDEVEVGSATNNPDGSRQLPGAWRLGNRPNLRQMHDDACRNRVQQAQVESSLLEQIERERNLTSGAGAAGVRVHTLPAHPRDIADDGEFHYAVLGPQAASESGKPSAQAKRFIDETTASDRPRVNRNAIVLAVPSRDGLDTARDRVREYLGWLTVQSDLKDQPTDPFRDQMLSAETQGARRKIPDAIRQAYSIVVTVNDASEVHAFKIAVGNDPLFVTIKADSRTRIQESAISAEAMLPGGPYDLWREGESFRRVSVLAGAFAEFPRLPKMLRQKEVLDTIAQGVLDGIWVARLGRPDGSAKTFWRASVDEVVMRDPSAEVYLPNEVALSEIAPALLAYEKLPDLWTNEQITVQAVTDYFKDGNTVAIPKNGYDDLVVIPRCEPQIVELAIAEAVHQGFVWLTNGPASIFKEAVPQGVLTATATLQAPPPDISPSALMATSIPDAWHDGKANVLAIITALSHQAEKTLPWSLVQTAIEVGLRTGWLELSPDSGPWPCELSGAQHAIVKTPETTGGQANGPSPKPPPGTVAAEAVLEANGIQDLADQIPAIAMAAVGNSLRFNLRIELGGETPPDPDAVAAINAILAKVSDDLHLG